MDHMSLCDYTKSPVELRPMTISGSSGPVKLFHFLADASSARSLKHRWKKCIKMGICCKGRLTTSSMDYSDERPMVSSSTSSSTCSSSGSSTGSSNEASWIDANEMRTVGRKRVMIVVDESQEAKNALLWALSHVVHSLDVVTLLYVLDPNASLYSDAAEAIVSDKTSLRSQERGCELIASLKSLCALRHPEVNVEVIAVTGDKGPTITRQAKKLDASVLVLGQKKPHFFTRYLRWKKEDQLVDYCIQHADCFTLSVRRRGKRAGGYLINTRCQKNFWLLA